MTCPACRNELTQVVSDGVQVEVCDGGCGGIWFDNYEFEKFDEPHESAGEDLLRVAQPKSAEVQDGSERQCPICKPIPMMERFSSVLTKVRIDECPSCGGVWLDTGELGGIRDEFPTEEARTEAAQRYFDTIFEDDLAAMRAETEAELARRRKFAHTFRFICPSYYVKGDQSWGAF